MGKPDRGAISLTVTDPREPPQIANWGYTQKKAPPQAGDDSRAGLSGSESKYEHQLDRAVMVNEPLRLSAKKKSPAVRATGLADYLCCLVKKQPSFGRRGCGQCKRSIITLLATDL